MPTKNPFEGEKKTRQQVAYERRTAEHVADHPDSYVVRAHLATGFLSGGMATSWGVGSLMYQPRMVHLVANNRGLAAMQSRNEAEWEKSWREIVSIGVAERPVTRLKLDAVGWHAPKLFIICKPDGDPVRPGEVAGVVRRFEEFAALRE